VILWIVKREIKEERKVCKEASDVARNALEGR
jgi:hypothetical protein